MSVSTERRLAAILAADVAGYSRHTERNEEASTATLSVDRAVVEESIAAHKGHMWNFRDEDIAKIMDGVYKSGVVAKPGM